MQLNKLIVILFIVAPSLSLLIQHLQFLDKHLQLLDNYYCCPDTYVFDVLTETCICPPRAQYVDLAGRCVACESPQYWNDQKKQCISSKSHQQHCPSGFIYDE